MTEKGMSRAEWIRWLGEAIETETAKPFEEIDYDFVEECGCLLDELTAEEISEEEIAKRIPKRKTAKPGHRKRWTAAIAAAVVLCMSLTVLAIPELRVRLLTALQLDVGESVENEGLTYVHSGEVRYYADMKELISAEQLDILSFDDAQGLLKIKTVTYPEETNTTVIHFEDETIRCQIFHDFNHVTDSIKSISEKHTNRDFEIYVVQKEHQGNQKYYAYLYFQNDTYIITCDLRETLVTVLNSIKRGEMGGTSSGFTQFGSTNEDSSSDGTRPSIGNMPNGGAMPDMDELPEGFDASQFEGEMPDMSEISDFGEMFGGGFSMEGGGANLNYTDDSLDSYSTIWEGEVGGTSDADHKRVVTALKNISEGTSFEAYMDIENLLKYMAVHIFSVNDDSLSGSMAHNYYLYEEGGRLNIIPWNYNLAFGGMGGGERATSVVDEAIDDAFSGTKFFDTLMANEEYHAQYYAVMQKLVEYLLGDEFENFYNRTRAQIDALVETDPNAFYTYEEYLTAVETFYELVKLRGQSIDGQLDGTIPSTATEQRNSDALIDASHLDISALGSMSMGGGFGGGGDFDFGNFGGRGEGNTDSDIAREITGTSAGTTQPNGEIPEGFDPSQAGGEIPEGFGSMQGDSSETPDNGDATQGGETATGNEAAPGGNFSFNMEGMLDMGNMPGFSSTGNSVQNTTSNLIMLGICVVLLIGALLFAKFYRRTPRRR